MGITRKQARIAIENKLSIQEIQKRFDENFTDFHNRALYNYAYDYDNPSLELYGINVNYNKDYPDKMQVYINHKPIANGELTDYDIVVSKYDILDAFVNETGLIELLVNDFYKCKNGLSCEKKEDGSEDDSDECCESDCFKCNSLDVEYDEDATVKKLNQLIDARIKETKQDSEELINVKVELANKIAQLENTIIQLENRIVQLEKFRRIGF